MKLIDTHCHFNHRDFAHDIEAAIGRAQAAGIEKFIVVGYDLETSRKAVQLAEQYTPIYASVGIHPHDAKAFNAAALNEIRKLAAHPKVVAIGEIGLDFYRDLSPRPMQYEALRPQLALADELKLPMIYHCRDAYPELLDLLEAEMPKDLAGVLHCFAGNLEEAKRGLDLGLYLGVDGPITFKNNDAQRELFSTLSIDRILIETDSPYLTPHPYRGKRNEPAYVALVAHKMAEVTGMSYEAFVQQSTENAERLFTRL